MRAQFEDLFQRFCWKSEHLFKSEILSSFRRYTLKKISDENLLFSRFHQWRKKDGGVSKQLDDASYGPSLLGFLVPSRNWKESQEPRFLSLFNFYSQLPVLNYQKARPCKSHFSPLNEFPVFFSPLESTKSSVFRLLTWWEKLMEKTFWTFEKFKIFVS